LDLTSKASIAENRGTVTPDNIISSADILEALRANEMGDRWIYTQLHKGKLLHDPGDDTWYKWAGHCWMEDTANDSLVQVEAVARIYLGEADRQYQLVTEATRDNDKGQADLHKKLAESLSGRVFLLRSRRRQENVRYLSAQGSDGLSIGQGKWNSNPWLLACQNGVINLRDVTGTLLPGRPGDFIRTACNVKWKGLNEPAPVWEKTLSEIFVKEDFTPDPDTLDFFGRNIGYAATGLRTEKAFTLLFGFLGDNGKTLLFEIIKSVLGSYAAKISTETLLSKKTPGHPGAARADLMGLADKRLLYASESDEGRRLNAAMLKELSGNDTIRARGLFAKKETEITPAYSVFLLTNNLPQVPTRKTDPIWRRLSIINFRRSFVPSPDPANPSQAQADQFLLEEKLPREGSGILAWIVRGCLSWQQHGLTRSVEVEKAVKAYQTSEDIFGQFIEECCNVKPEYSVQAGAFYKSYCVWSDKNYTKPLSNRAFGGDMAGRFRRDDERVRTYHGVGLKPENEENEKTKTNTDAGLR
jgi:putative DNA primase/helicase